MKRKKKTTIESQLRCCFCKDIIDKEWFANDPYPVASSKYVCCDYCNATIVMPARFLICLEDESESKE